MAMISRGRAKAGLVVLVLVCCVASVLWVEQVSAQQSIFKDVPDDAYYTTPVSALAADGVFVGTECGDELFCPDKPITRWQMAVWIVRVLDGQEPAAIDTYRFDDVGEDDWYAAHVERMFELRVTQGCGDGTNYCPDPAVTRAQMAAFLTRAYSLPDGPDRGFGDVPVDAWYVDEVAALAASGITQGCGDGTNFCPDRNTTRAQMATFLYRAINPGVGAQQQETEACNFSDRSDDVRSAVFQVHASDGIGTAFYIGRDEWLTAAHVVAGDSSVTLRNGSTELQATVLGGDSDADMAMLAASGSGIPPLSFGRLQDMNAGEPLFVVGFPLYVASEPSVARGVLSRTEIDADLGTLIVTDASVNPGNSGGPLVDECGDVLGMVVEKFVAQDVEGIAYAIAETTLQERMPAMRTGGPESIAVRKTYDECFADSTDDDDTWDAEWFDGTDGWWHVAWTPTTSTTADSAGAFLDASTHDLSDHDAVIPQGCDFTPYLDVGCSTDASNNHLWAGVWWSGLPVTGDSNAAVPVRYGFDNTTTVRESWTATLDAQGSYLFGNEAVEFMTKLLTSNVLSFVGQDHRGREAIQARFELHGASDALAHLQDVCGWDSSAPPIRQFGPDYSFTGQWTLDLDETDPLTRVRTLAVATIATEHAFSSTLDQSLYAAPHLLVVCTSDGVWYLSIWWGGKFVADQLISTSPVIYGVPVSYRFADSELRSATWEEGSPTEFTISYDVLSFWEEMWDSDQLVFRAWNYDDSVIGTATFNVSGFPGASQWLHDICTFE